jgi:FKBP-type peptidyl-prolyl cis-trans isomerase (trigger factor)
MKMQRKKKLGEKVIKLLEQGYTPTEITQRMAVSYNYAWKLWKDMKEAAQEAETLTEAVKETLHNITQGRQQYREAVEADTNVDAILNERGSRYGNFFDHATITYRLKEVARNFAEEKGKTFAVDQCEAMDMIFHKIGRILNGDPNYADSWIDIAGYAKLVADRLEGKTR